MRHRKHTFKIGRRGSHRRAMLANMAISLIMHGEIKTTLVRAKELRRFVERLITMGKKGDLHRRRLVLSRLRGETAGETAAKRLFDVIAPSYQERAGGYTRIVKLGMRRGDATEMCLIQLLGFEKDPLAVQAKPSAKTAEKEVVPSVEQIVSSVAAGGHA